MSEAFWQGQRARAVDDLFQTGADHAQDWAARRRQRQADEQYLVERAAAVEAAKQTGKLDPQFQRTILEDEAVGQAGIKQMLMRELARFDPNHPLLKSQECRVAVADVTRIKYNRANRPADHYYDEFAPAPDEAERIFDAFK